MTAGAGRERVLRLARRRQGVTARELAAAGIHRQVLTRLVADGQIVRVARGVYQLPAQGIGEHAGLVLASMAVPQGVICLLSALQFHGLGTQLPTEVWIALDRRARRPQLAYPPLRVLRFSGAALTEGVERHRIDGREVSVYCIEKTLADCFKYRNKIGLDVALEAMREARLERRIDVDVLWRYARIDRVTNVMRPYLEAVG
jgi:predicted transcriptional regulator of viral defense system